jgi:hypothetical protein
MPVKVISKVNTLDLLLIVRAASAELLHIL